MKKTMHTTTRKVGSKSIGFIFLVPRKKRFATVVVVVVVVVLKFHYTSVVVVQ
jgi:hypothetical protein